LETESSSQIVAKEESITYIPITTYSFENNSNNFKVFFTKGFENLKKHSPEKIQVEFKVNSLTVKIHDWEGKNLKFHCGNLHSEIKPENCTYKQSSSGLIVTLVKVKSEFWDSLEKKASLVSKKPKEKANPDDPTGGLMDMMKEMYQNGDDNMKKIIAESWTKAQDKNSNPGGMPGGMPGMPGMSGMPGGMPGMNDDDDE